MTLEEILQSVWQQVMVEDARSVTIEGTKFAVRKTSSKRLREVDFTFDGRQLRGLEQNPQTKSRWAEMARDGAKVMQFLEDGRYVAVVADGKVRMYTR